MPFMDPTMTEKLAFELIKAEYQLSDLNFIQYLGTVQTLLHKKLQGA